MRDSTSERSTFAILPSRLVKSKKRGRVRTYEIAPERFKVVEDWLTARRQLWEARLDRFDQYVKQLKERESDS